MKKAGILGGAFNPPHIGHLILAQEVVENVGLDKVFFVPTNISPHKESNIISAYDRLKMVKLAIADNEYFEALDLEIKRGGVSYTINTVRELINKYPQYEFHLIIGSDLANTFSAWKDFEELKKIIKIIVVCRQYYPLSENNDFITVDITQVCVSSSQIRKFVEQGSSIRYLVKSSVADYIKEQSLYSKREE